MSWIQEIPYQEAEGQLKKLYDRIKGPDGNIDNILSVHSLRPHSLLGHMMLYKNVLHNRNNALPKWYLETLGVYVSFLNKCEYCVEHHFAGLKRLLKDGPRADEIRKKIASDSLESVFEGKEMAGIRYAKKLCEHPWKIQQSDILALKKAGISDGEILEINQVVAYFCYVNRTVLGLGVNLSGDILGLSPNDSDDPDNWSHQ